MNKRTIISALIILSGECIILAAFLQFREKTPDNILILNILISSLAYLLIFNKFRAPWIDLQDRSQKKTGFLGVTWFAAWMYSTAAVGVMFSANLLMPLAFNWQVIIHAVLIFFLLLGISGAYYAKDKTSEIYVLENESRKGIAEMRAAMRQLKDRINELSPLPEKIIRQLAEIEEELRFISPSNSNDARELERSVTEAINTISYAVSNFAVNEEQIEQLLRKIKQLHQNRKQINSI